jgi:hypothetical protein
MPILTDSRAPSGPRLALVEGRDDQEFLKNWAMFAGVTDATIIQLGGKTNWPAKVVAVTNTEGFGAVESLLLVRDADDSAKGAFESCQEALRRAGLPYPPNPGVFTSGSPRVAVVIVADPQRGSGAIEDLAWHALAGTDARECVLAYEECLSGRGIQVREKDRSKARIRAFIAYRRTGLSLGPAASAGLFDFASPALAETTELLRAW